MKKWITVMMFGGLFATASATTTSTQPTVGTDAAVGSAADSETDPCPWCCPPWQCGFNGPSFDGTTAPAECAAP